jgi:hypothetical protein
MNFLKGEIDSILVFVSHRVGYHHATSFTLKLYSSPACSPPQLQCGIDSAIDPRTLLHGRLGCQ